MKDALGSVLKHLETEGEKQNNIGELLTALDRIATNQEEAMKGMDKMHEIMGEIMRKEPPRMPEYPDPLPFPEFPKEIRVSNLPPPADNSKLERLILELTNAINNLPAPEVVISAPESQPVKTETPNLMRPATIRRPRNKWIIATSPQASGTDAIVGDLDGVNKDFYLPGSPIKNSEQVRLNQGSPLSYGVDYTMTANKLSFVIAPTGSLEVKYQQR